MPDKKKSLWSSFQITDRESCEKAIRNGGVAALISAAVTGVFGYVGAWGRHSSDTQLNYLLDPLMLIDTVLVAILAIFVFRKSRIASTVLLAYFVTSKLMMWIEVGRPSGGIMTILFLLYYVTAMRGTYLWHSKYRDLPIEVSESVSAVAHGNSALAASSSGGEPAS